MYLKTAFLIATLALAAESAAGQNVNITEHRDRVDFVLDGELMSITRIQDQDNRLDNEFTKTSRACPPFCIHDMNAAPGVETLGENELIAFLETQVVSGTGLLIDSRLPEWYAKGTIPGAINIPFTTLSPNNPHRDEILTALGGVQQDDSWDFSAATELAMFCNGPWCDQSPRAIRNLVGAGYPADKLYYYRGGMQLWQLLGLTVARP